MTRVLRRAPKPVAAALALVVLGAVLALIAGASRSPSLLLVAMAAFVLGGLCMVSMTLVAEGRLLWAMRRDPAGVPGGLLEIVAELAAEANVAMPRVKVVRSKSPDAHVSFWRGPPLIVTRGLLDGYGEEARTGTLGHEIGHIAAGHIRYLRWVVAITVPEALAVVGLLTLSVPLHAISATSLIAAFVVTAGEGLILGWTSRRHEFVAHRIGARLTGVAAQLAALDELARRQREPDPGRLAKIARLFSTHPTVAERRAALEALATTAAT